MHYNSYKALLHNDNEILLPTRCEALNTLLDDLDDIFIQNFSYIFYINDHYMAATDYIDCKEAGIQPEKGSEYFVEYFIQITFDRIIKTKRPDIAIELKNNSKMELE